MSLLKKLARDERGMETVEWAIHAALIVAGLVADGLVDGRSAVADRPPNPLTTLAPSLDYRARLEAFVSCTPSSRRVENSIA